MVMAFWEQKKYFKSAGMLFTISKLQLFLKQDFQMRFYAAQRTEKQN